VRRKKKERRKYIFCVEKKNRVVTWRHVCLGVGVEVLARHPSRRAEAPLRTDVDLYTHTSLAG
jgi:hypothetical protein